MVEGPANNQSSLQLGKTREEKKVCIKSNSTDFSDSSIFFSTHHIQAGLASRGQRILRKSDSKWPAWLTEMPDPDVKKE